MEWQCPDTSSCCWVPCECKWMASFVPVGWFPGCVVDFLYVLFLFYFFFFPPVHLLKKFFSVSVSLPFCLVPSCNLWTCWTASIKYEGPTSFVKPGSRVEEMVFLCERDALVEWSGVENDHRQSHKISQEVKVHCFPCRQNYISGSVGVAFLYPTEDI